MMAASLKPRLQGKIRKLLLFDPSLLIFENLPLQCPHDYMHINEQGPCARVLTRKNKKTSEKCRA